MGYHNTSYYSNETVDQHIHDALTVLDPQQAYEHWKKAQWDGSAGFTVKGDASLLWAASPNHIYRFGAGLDVGRQELQSGSMGWALLHNITEWRWECRASAKSWCLGCG